MRTPQLQGRNRKPIASPTVVNVLRTRVEAAPPRAIHKSETHPEIKRRNRQNPIRRAANPSHFLHGKMTLAYEIKRQPGQQKIGKVIDRKIAPKGAPRGTLLENFRNAGVCAVGEIVKSRPLAASTSIQGRSQSRLRSPNPIKNGRHPSAR